MTDQQYTNQNRPIRNSNERRGAFVKRPGGGGVVVGGGRERCWVGLSDAGNGGYSIGRPM